MWNLWNYIQNMQLFFWIYKFNRWFRVLHSTDWYTKVNNKYIKDYDKNKESLLLKYWDVNNLDGWAMLQKIFSN